MTYQRKEMSREELAELKKACAEGRYAQCIGCGAWHTPEPGRYLFCLDCKYPDKRKDA